MHSQKEERAENKRKKRKRTVDIQNCNQVDVWTPLHSVEVCWHAHPSTSTCISRLWSSICSAHQHLKTQRLLILFTSIHSVNHQQSIDLRVEHRQAKCYRRPLGGWAFGFPIWYQTWYVQHGCWHLVPVLCEPQRTLESMWKLCPLILCHLGGKGTKEEGDAMDRFS